MEKDECNSQNNEISETFQGFAVHECKQILFEILNEINENNGNGQGDVNSREVELQENEKKEDEKEKYLEQKEADEAIEGDESKREKCSDDEVCERDDNIQRLESEYNADCDIGKADCEADQVVGGTELQTFCIQSTTHQGIEINGSNKDITLPCDASFNVRIIEEQLNTVRIDWDLLADAEVYKIEKFHRRRGWEQVAWTGNGPTTIENLDENFSYRLRIKAQRFCEWHGLFEDYKMSPCFLVTTLPPLPTTLSLHRAIKKGQQFLVKRILRRRPSLLEYPGPNGYLPLANSIISDQHSVIDVLLSHGANVHIGNPLNSRTPLQLAFYYGRLAVARILLNRKALLEATDINDMTACHFAVDANQLELLRFGLENGANVNARDACGWSLLSRAVVMRADVGILKLLLTHGANAKLKDKLHKTSVDLAKIYKNTIATDYFVKALRKKDEVN